MDRSFTVLLAVCLALLISSSPATAVWSGPQQGRRLLAPSAALFNSLVADTNPPGTPDGAAALVTASGQSGQSSNIAASTFADAAKKAQTEADNTKDMTKKDALVSNTKDALLLAYKQGGGDKDGQNQKVKDLVATLGKAITAGGSSGEAAKQTIAEAISEAAASGGGKEAVAEATAVAICQGGETAVAFSSAVATSIAMDPVTACTTVNVAVATAASACAPKLVIALTSSFAKTITACASPDTAAILANVRGAGSGRPLPPLPPGVTLPANFQG